jgi:hypothetical protein
MVVIIWTQYQTVSENGRTVISVEKDGLRVCENHGQIDDVNEYFKTMIKAMPPLSCICARFICQHGIRYDAVGVARLRECIARHGTAQGKTKDFSFSWKITNELVLFFISRLRLHSKDLISASPNLATIWKSSTSTSQLLFLSLFKLEQILNFLQSTRP